tara:strand:+ start:322 stop:1473 length:1152 start_codon:yes stop_codon:yes gene_type:complete
MLEKNQENSIIVGRHYDFIDGLRGVAILMVLWFHSAGYANRIIDSTGADSNTYHNFAFFGATGVDLFFVISGFLITGILIDSVNTQQKPLEKFYIRRFLRIFPAYYALLFVVLILYFVIAFDLPDLGLTLSHILYLQNWSPEFSRAGAFEYLDHTWSLAIEEQFYLVWPALFVFLYKRSLYFVFIALICMVLLSWGLRLHYVSMGYSKFAYTATLCRIDALAFGAMISLFYRYFYTWLECLKIVFAVLAICSFLCVAYILISQQTIFDAYKVLICYGLTLCSILYFSYFSFLLASNDKHFFKRLLENRVLRDIGVVSYGLYLLHVPIMRLIAKLLVPYDLTYFPAHLLVFVLGLLVSYVLAYFSFKYFEKPVLKLKDKWASYQ